MKLSNGNKLQHFLSQTILQNTGPFYSNPHIKDGKTTEQTILSIITDQLFIYLKNIMFNSST